MSATSMLEQRTDGASAAGEDRAHRSGILGRTPVDNLAKVKIAASKVGSWED